MECEEFILPDWSPPEDPASDDDDEGVGVGGDDCNVGGKSVLFPGLSSAGAEAAREPCIFIIIIITGNGHGNFH